MASKSSILDIDTQIEKLRERRRSLIVKSADRFARAATRWGLAEMEITDEEVDRIYEEIAARFRKDEKKGSGGADAPTHRPGDSGTRAPEAVSNDG